MASLPFYFKQLSFNIITTFYYWLDGILFQNILYCTIFLIEPLASFSRPILSTKWEELVL